MRLVDSQEEVNWMSPHDLHCFRRVVKRTKTNYELDELLNVRKYGGHLQKSQLDGQWEPLEEEPELLNE